MIFNTQRIVLILISAILFSCSNEKNRIERVVNAELAIHPKSQLVDLYKNFFQDVFGPGHMAPDSSSAARYLNYELDNSDSFESFLIQSLEYRGEFVRVNLSIVKSGQITKEEFLAAFLRSAEKFAIPEVNDWRKEWAYILTTIRNMDISLSHFVEDVNYIDSVLNSGEYVVHHSEIYVKEYDPHYRLIHKDELNCLNLSKH